MTAEGGIQRFDPDARTGTAALAFGRASQSALARRVGAALVRRSDGPIRALTGTPLAPLLILPFANLTTTGARSGQTRLAVVLYFSDHEDVILVASNWGGDRHPSWYHNLITHPAAVLMRGGRTGTYSAVEVTEPTEHDRLLALADDVYTGYSDYRARAGKIGRGIPVMRLSLVR